jgi:invasion protein IalB
MTVVTPNDVSFPSSVHVAMDEKDAQPTELVWTRCLPVGCFAAGVPTQENLRRWRGSVESGRITFKSAGGQDIAVPFSFRGLAQAIDALAKEK